MKQISYILRVKKLGTEDSTAWDEPMNEYVENGVTVEEHGKSIIDYFNSTLRPHETARVFVAAIETEKSTKNLKHDWVKVSLVTERGGFDKYKCTMCNATGKRHGLSSGVDIDKKYEKYRFNCPNKKLN